MQQANSVQSTMKRFVFDLLDSVVERGRSFVKRPPRPDVRLIEFMPSLESLAVELLSVKGEASGVAIGRDLLKQYAASDPSRRHSFLRFVAAELGPQQSSVEKAVADYLSSGTDTNIEELHRTSEPRRQELLRRLNLAPGGTTALVRMREDVLNGLTTDKSLEPLNTDFVHLFASWFNCGFLVLKRIDWKSPANVLEKIIEYEAVHEISDWNELRRRLQPVDRRCFAFFHPQLIDEPLIFVEVALTDHIPDSIQSLLSDKREPIDMSAVTTAVFYSISNCQKGLSQISFGSFLIKQVVEEIRAELSTLHTFVTLSPVPGFRSWYEKEVAVSTNFGKPESIGWMLAGEPSVVNHAVLEKMQSDLCRSAARYLVDAKTPKHRPLDPVARFHLGNGARLERINGTGDSSQRGWHQSFGVMVNYLYDLRTITSNYESYARDGTVCVSPSVSALLENTAAEAKQHS